MTAIRAPDVTIDKRLTQQNLVEEGGGGGGGRKKKEMLHFVIHMFNVKINSLVQHRGLRAYTAAVLYKYDNKTARMPFQ